MSDSPNGVILEMLNISKHFGGVRALQDVSFRCQTGKVHALVGENGAGKSTLIKILAGAYHADDGEIVYKGQHYDHLSTRHALNIGIRVIYQELNLVSELTVAENIFLGNEPKNRFGLIDVRGLHQRAAALLDRLGVQLNLRQPVGELTVASRQMVEIAKALSQDADLLVMDEPSAILAGHELEQLFNIIRSLNEQGVTIIYISHRLEEIFEIADEVTVLKDGQVVGTHPVADIDRPQLIGMMVGRSLEEVFPTSEHAIGEVILEARQVVTDHIPTPFNLTLHAGETLGLAGMVGSGRTELARAIFGADRIRSGSLLVDGNAVHMRSPRRAVASGLALVPEDRKTQGLFMGLPVRNNVSMATLHQFARFGVMQRRKEAAAVEQARQNLDISMASPSQEVQFLSGGNQQKVVLAKWLETAPRVIILDEPTRGVDVGAKFEIYQLMRQLTERGVAILMISSELPEVIGMSDRVLVMHGGSIVGELDRAEVTEEKIIELATTGQLEHHAEQNNGDKE